MQEPNSPEEVFALHKLRREDPQRFLRSWTNGCGKTHEIFARISGGILRGQTWASRGELLTI